MQSALSVMSADILDEKEQLHYHNPKVEEGLSLIII